MNLSFQPPEADDPRDDDQLSMAAHTPSPWLFRGKSESVHKPSSTHPYGKTIFRFDEEEPPNDVDLDLILAAPYLLEALTALCAKLPRPDERSYTSYFARLELDVSRAAIAKATGVKS